MLNGNRNFGIENDKLKKKNDKEEKEILRNENGDCRHEKGNSGNNKTEGFDGIKIIKLIAVMLEFVIGHMILIQFFQISFVGQHLMKELKWVTEKQRRLGGV